MVKRHADNAIWSKKSDEPDIHKITKGIDKRIKDNFSNSHNILRTYTDSAPPFKSSQSSKPCWPSFSRLLQLYLYYSSWPLSTYCHALYFKGFMFTYVVSNIKHPPYKQGPYLLLVRYSAHHNLYLTKFSAKSKSSISNYWFVQELILG